MKIHHILYNCRRHYICAVLLIICLPSHANYQTAVHSTSGGASISVTKNADGTHTLTPVPTAGWIFDYWYKSSYSGNSDTWMSVGKIYTEQITIPVSEVHENGSHSYVLYRLFCKTSSAKYKLTVTTNNDNYGTVSGGGTYAVNSKITITATPKTGYHFVQWSDGTKSTSRTITVKAEASYKAEFASNQYTITVTAEHGHVDGGGTYDYLSQIELVAIPDEHYHFVQWSDGIKDNPRSITVKTNVSYVALFSIDQFTISATAEHGHIDGGGTYDYLSQIELNAIPDEHYHFVLWSDGIFENPREVTILGDSTFTAIFEKDCQQETIHCTIVSESPYGNISFIGELLQNSSITLNAEAPDCSKFVRWSDNNTDNPRSVTITQDSTFTAIFEKIQYKLSVDLNDTEHGEIEAKETNE